jgi:hypothetical protein
LRFFFLQGSICPRFLRLFLLLLLDLPVFRLAWTSVQCAGDGPDDDREDDEANRYQRPARMFFDELRSLPPATLLSGLSTASVPDTTEPPPHPTAVYGGDQAGPALNRGLGGLCVPLDSERHGSCLSVPRCQQPSTRPCIGRMTVEAHDKLTPVRVA